MVYRVSKLKNMSNCEILGKVQFHNATHTNTPKTGPGFLKISIARLDDVSVKKLGCLA